MTFGEKLLKLRKSNAMSQEALAEKLNTSRQAISKWENGQGFPETEKLLIISNIFNVSIDYLLKDTPDSSADNEKGYYVSKEMAEGFLINEKKQAKYVAVGIGTIIASVIPYLILKDNTEIYPIIIAFMITIGIGLIISVVFIEEEYKVLKEESLIFDDKFLNELKGKYNAIKKKYITLITIGACFAVAGGSIIFLFEKGLAVTEKVTEYYSISTFFIVIGIGSLIYFTSVMESYELLVKNHEHTNKLSYKLLKKFREKKENL